MNSSEFAYFEPAGGGSMAVMVTQLSETHEVICCLCNRDLREKKTTRYNIPLEGSSGRRWFCETCGHAELDRIGF